MSQYRKKPVVIEAEPFDPVSLPLPFSRRGDPVQFNGMKWLITTLEGDHECTSGDMIIRGVKGEFYPCKPDIFAATYDPVEAKVEVKKHREREYGIDHPWRTFDNWHKTDHEAYGYSWPCTTPLRCLWRYTRKTDNVLTQEGTELRAALAVCEKERDDVAGLRELLKTWYRAWQSDVIDDDAQQPELYPLLHRAAILTVKVLYPGIIEQANKAIAEEIKCRAALGKNKEATP